MSDDTAQQQSLSLLNTRAGPLSLRAWLILLPICFVALLYWKQLPPDISNAEYVQTLISKNTLSRTAGAIIRDARPEVTSGNTAEKTAEDAKWAAIANNLASCMEKEAEAYLISGDPFLNQHFDPKTPTVISTRLLTVCDAMHYLSPDKGN